MKNRWKVDYYISHSGDNPIREFLDSCPPKTRAKAFRIFLHVEEYGLQAIIPHVKKLTKTPLWEIRVLGRRGIRILYVVRVKRKLLLLHAFYKKTKKTPKKEIKIALKRLTEYKKYCC